MIIWSVLLVAAGAFTGGFLRWLLAQLIPGKRATFCANILACVVAGAILVGNPAELTEALLVIGFCGALSTWSTLARELGELCQEKRRGAALGYAGVSTVLGGSAVLAGMLGRVLFFDLAGL